MRESGRTVTLTQAQAQSLMRHPVQALEHVMLDAARRVFGAVELSEPVTRWLFKEHVRVLRNVPYLGTGHRAHTLDVYRPMDVVEGELRPIVFYVHGGGFAVCSKDTHWVMAQSYARRGYVVVNVNYRLAPKHPFPRALSDVCAAYLWLLDNAARFGGDTRRIVVAGESAGANLVSSLALIHAMQRPEPYAQAVFKRNVAPRAVVAACGIFEVSNTHRFETLAAEAWGITRLAIHHVGKSYLPGVARWEGEHDLANPLHLLERSHALHRPLPSFFVPCGGADPILDDSRRLSAALAARGVHHEARTYEGEIHAFHALWWRREARRCWQDTHDFLGAVLNRKLTSESAAA